MAEEIKYKLVYEGEEAERNRLPAHQGATSIEGVTWSISLLAHYAATGEIRTRGSLSPKIKVYLRPSRQGSFINELFVFITEPNNLFITSVAGAYAAGSAGQIVNTLIVKTLKEVCGLIYKHTRHDEKWLKKLPSGDTEALVDKVEPSMRRAHDVIDDGASTLDIKKGQTSLITFDRATKAYVNADNLGDESTRTVSVGAFNANSGNGRVYLPDVGKTVPFFAPKGLDTATYAALTYSLDQYVNGRPSQIKITSQEILAGDNRVKKLIVSQAMKLL
ncbi:hypothetical protein P9273_17950 [Mesorhizobium sp. WSM4935]|uniref:DUF7946 domain-containing protein n=1 Tax=Mesorhizobium sp. WSM4935 TaxID=3038547 RepID=UPI000504BF3C|nr:hypothetical protein [Mesorhizobium sp. WSM4935]MDG4876979.1 hypothetical protein [Mesorhizobium sp. WSM4935]CDX40623.1 conserved hypothetical protein [Mesorhizobium sp. SOD10]